MAARRSSRCWTTAPGCRRRMRRRRSSASSAVPPGPWSGRAARAAGLAIVGALAARWGGSASLQARAEGGTRAECGCRPPRPATLPYHRFTCTAVRCLVDACAPATRAPGPHRACSSRSRSASSPTPSRAGRSRPASTRCHRRGVSRPQRPCGARSLRGVRGGDCDDCAAAERDDGATAAVDRPEAEHLARDDGGDAARAGPERRPRRLGQRFREVGLGRPRQARRRLSKP